MKIRVECPDEVPNLTKIFFEWYELGRELAMNNYKGNGVKNDD